MCKCIDCIFIFHVRVIFLRVVYVCWLYIHGSFESYLPSSCVRVLTVYSWFIWELSSFELCTCIDCIFIFHLRVIFLRVVYVCWLYIHVSCKSYLPSTCVRVLTVFSFFIRFELCTCIFIIHVSYLCWRYVRVLTVYWFSCELSSLELCTCVNCIFMFHVSYLPWSCVRVLTACFMWQLSSLEFCTCVDFIFVCHLRVIFLGVVYVCWLYIHVSSESYLPPGGVYVC